MTFVSCAFLVFFAIVMLALRLLSHRGQNRLLLIGSCVFYGWWDWRFLGLLFASSGIDFFCALVAGDMRRSRKTRVRAMATSVVANLAILAFFKYFNFFFDSARLLLAHFGFTAHPTTLSIVLPVGISFYTFQSLSYSVDVFRGDIAPCRSATNYFLYVAFFPQLVAGPIQRARDLLAQVERVREWQSAGIVSGIQLALFGYAKKMFVADNLGPLVDSVYTARDPSAGMVVLATYAFAFQIYCDFSGYTDIARGCARMMGFDLQQNFRTPYLATDPRDFWRRWHISLSSWLRDYLYVPLGGNRGGGARTTRNLLVTMLLGGLWHGANWTFVAWGTYHGLLLVVFRHLGNRGHAGGVNTGVRRGPMFWVKAIAYFHLTCFGWLLFRADNLNHVGRLLQALARPGPVVWQFAVAASMFIAPVLVLDAFVHRTDDPEPWQRAPASLQAALLVGVFYLIVLLGSPHAVSFIYFQF